MINNMPVDDFRRVKIIFWFFFRWVKKVHLGRGSSGKRVNLLDFIQRQRKRTKCRMMLLKCKRKIAKRRGDPCLSMSLAREKWRRGRRNAKTKYLAPIVKEDFQRKTSATKRTADSAPLKQEPLKKKMSMKIPTSKTESFSFRPHNVQHSSVNYFCDTYKPPSIHQ